LQFSATSEKLRRKSDQASRQSLARVAHGMHRRRHDAGERPIDTDSRECGRDRGQNGADAEEREPKGVEEEHVLRDFAMSG